MTNESLALLNVFYFYCIRKKKKNYVCVISYFYVADCYWDSFDTSPLEIRALLTKLHTVVENEILLTKRMLAIDGLVKMLLISSEVLPDTQPNENKVSVKN